MQKNDLFQRKYASMTEGNSCHKAVGPIVGFQKYIIQYKVVQSHSIYYAVKTSSISAVFWTYQWSSCYLLTYLLTYSILTYLLTYFTYLFYLTYFTYFTLLTYLLTHSLTHSLTPWKRVLEKLTSFQLVKKFPAFYGTWRFITTFSNVRHLYLSGASLISSMPTPPPSHFLMIHLNIVLPSMPGSPKWSLSLRIPHQNSVYVYPLPHMRYMLCPSPSCQFYHLKNIIIFLLMLH
jgi:hypothetical protein